LPRCIFVDGHPDKLPVMFHLIYPSSFRDVLSNCWRMDRRWTKTDQKSSPWARAKNMWYIL